MSMCDQYGELLLDHLYGLLDETEAANLRGHLESCANCQADLVRAQRQQKLLAQAARVYEQVPPFVVPDFDKAVEPPSALASSAVVSHAPVPHTRSRWFGFTPLALAASIVIAVGVGYVQFQRGMADRQTQLAEAKAEIAAIDAQFAAATAKFEQQGKQLAAGDVAGPLHLQVSGPTNYQTDTTNSIVVQTSDADGKPRSQPVTVQVVDLLTKQPIVERTAVAPGLLAFDVPADVEGDPLLVKVLANSSAGMAQIDQPLTPARPQHATHLALNKAAYQIGELLFFRTLTLDQFHLQPPRFALDVRYALVNEQGQTVKHLDSVTGPGGIGGGEFALTADIPTGSYFLEVQPRNGSQLLPQKRRVEIVRASTPQVEFDRAQYQAGDNAVITLRSRDQRNAAPLQNQKLMVQNSNIAGAPSMTAPQERKTDERGQVVVPVPKSLSANRLPLQIQIPGVPQDEKVQVAIPVVPTQLAIDFFPEGGKLIEGVKTRVYYRVRSPQGDVVHPQGRVIVRSAKETLHQSAPGQGLGVFEFVPHQGESYSTAITAPATEIAAPFEALGIRATGLALRVPETIRNDERIELHLQYKGSPTDVQIAVVCRGRVVHQKALTIREGSQTVSLMPPADATGVLHVILREVSDGQLVQIAERLVFRAPRRHVDLAVSVEGNKVAHLRAGQNGILEVQGKDERNRPTQFWVMAAVVQDKVGISKEPSLPAFFYLGSEARNADDLEEAPSLVHDSAEERKRLDLFLGTHGWRASPTASLPQFALAGKATEAKGTGTLFFRENASREQLRRQQQSQVAQQLTELRTDLEARRLQLMQEKEARAARYNALLAELAEYEELLPRTLHLVLGALVMTALLVGAIFVAVGLVQIVRQRSATPAFVVAFGSLGLCLLLYVSAAPTDNLTSTVKTGDFAAAKLPPVPEVQLTQAAPAREEARQQSLAKAKASTEKEGVTTDRMTADTKAVSEKNRPAMRLSAPPAAGGPKVEEAGRADAALAPSLNSGALSPRAGGMALPSAAVDPALEKRFASAQARQDGQRNSVPAAKMMRALAGPRGARVEPEKKASLENARALSEQTQNFTQNVVQPYNYRRNNAGAAIPDTLLWQPAVFSENGKLQLPLELPAQPASYTVILLANTPDGRLGFYQSRLDIPKK